MFLAGKLSLITAVLSSIPLSPSDMERALKLALRMRDKQIQFRKSTGGSRIKARHRCAVAENDFDRVRKDLGIHDGECDERE